jgi:hypothetical protein
VPLGPPHLKQTRQGRPILQEQGSEASMEWCDLQEQKPHLLWMPSKGSHGKRLSKW